MNNILVAVDLDRNDGLMLEWAVSLGQKYHCKLWIVHIAAPDPDFVGYDVGPEYIREGREKELNAEAMRLLELSSRAQAAGVEAESLLVKGPTVELIEQEIQKLGIDLLVIGSHRHGLLYTTLVGHTSSKLIRHQTVPILIIPLPNES